MCTFSEAFHEDQDRMINFEALPENSIQIILKIFQFKKIRIKELRIKTTFFLLTNANGYCREIL